MVASDGGAPSVAAVPGDTSVLGELLRSPALRLLTVTMVVFMATQVCLNFFADQGWPYHGFV